MNAKTECTKCVLPGITSCHTEQEKEMDEKFRKDIRMLKLRSKQQERSLRLPPPVPTTRQGEHEVGEDHEGQRHQHQHHGNTPSVTRGEEPEGEQEAQKPRQHGEGEATPSILPNPVPTTQRLVPPSETRAEEQQASEVALSPQGTCPNLREEIKKGTLGGVH